MEYINKVLYNKAFIMDRLRRQKQKIDIMSEGVSRWIGSSTSLVLHTALFVIAFILPFFGVRFETVLLVMTTIVSLEAIYLSIFIQMSVNRQAKELELVSEDIEEIQEDVEEIQQDVEGIEKDVDEIQKDVDEIQEDVEEIQEDVEEIEKDVDEMSEDVEEYEEDEKRRDAVLVEKIEVTLMELAKEVQKLKSERNTLIKKGTKSKK